MSTSTASAPRARSERASVLSAVPSPAKTTSTGLPLAASSRGTAPCASPGLPSATRWPASRPTLRAPSGSSGARRRAEGAGAPSPSSRGPAPDVGSAPSGSARGRGRATPCPVPCRVPAAPPRAPPAE
eukprot:4416902-Pleurochrysis_carterae.AAC.2